MKKLLIGFDIDGTLVDSLSQSYKIDCELISRHGGEVPNLDEYRRAITDGNWQSFYDTFGVTSPINIQEYYNMVAKEPLNPIIGAKELLEYLTQKWDIPIFAVSINLSKLDVLKKLKICGLDFFPHDSVYITQRIKTRAIRREVAKRNFSLDDTFYVGDTTKDIIESRRAGVHPVGILGHGDTSYNLPEAIHSANPDYIFCRLGEVSNLIWRH